MSALFNLFYIYDPWFFHVVRMSVLAGLAAFTVLAYRYWKKNIAPKFSRFRRADRQSCRIDRFNFI